MHLASKAAAAFFARRLADAGSTFGIWKILASLRTGAPLIQRELADRLSIEGPTLTRYLVQMEADVLIRRRRSASDRRAATVELTKAGHAAYRRLEAIAMTGYAELMRGFSPEEVDTLRDMLLRIQRNAQHSSSG